MTSEADSRSAATPPAPTSSSALPTPYTDGDQEIERRVTRMVLGGPRTLRACNGLHNCTDRHEVYPYYHRGLLLEIRDVSQDPERVVARYYYAPFEAEAPVAVDLLGEASSGKPELQRYYTITDRQGSVFGVTDTAGQVVEWVQYDAWGTPQVQTAPPVTTDPQRSSVGNRLLFQSHLWDADIDLYFMRARVFDPFVGQFLQRGPSGYEDSVNLYAGFANDPANNRDPSGEPIEEDLLGSLSAFSSGPGMKSIAERGTWVRSGPSLRQGFRAGGGFTSQIRSIMRSF